MAATHEPASPPAPVGEPGSAPRRDLPSGAQLEGGEMGPASLSESCRSPGAPPDALGGGAGSHVAASPPSSGLGARAALASPGGWCASRSGT